MHKSTYKMDNIYLDIKINTPHKIIDKNFRTAKILLQLTTNN